MSTKIPWYKPCSTAQFWQYMRSIKFVRLSLHTGAIGQTLFYCAHPPEEDPTHFSRVRTEILTALSFDAQGNRMS
jgi:hypothetical protein